MPLKLPPLPRRKRLRRVGILCCHCLRNLAFYKAGWKGPEFRRNGQFWKNANSNFLDVAVLEWCKLFADKRGQHHWRKLITDEQGFYAGLLASLKLTDVEFAAYIADAKTYRDKFVAHLDDLEVMHPPRTRIASRSAAYLFDYLRAHEEEEGCFHDAPVSASCFYRLMAVQGWQEYHPQQA